MSDITDLGAEREKRKKPLFVVDTPDEHEPLRNAIDVINRMIDLIDSQEGYIKYRDPEGHEANVGALEETLDELKAYLTEREESDS